MSDTPDMEAIRRKLDEDGYCVIPGALSPEDLQVVRDALDRILADDDANGVAQRYGPTLSNQRVWALLNRGEAFIRLATHPLALQIIREMLGYHEILLSTLTANVTAPGGDREIGRMHTDQGFLPESWPYRVISAAAFFLDDYTEENGATLVVPGSHKWGKAPDRSIGFAPDAPARLTGPAGSMAIWDGRLHHATGLNKTADQRRRGVIATYNSPFLRGQENWCRTLDPKMLELHPELPGLTGFVEWQTLGGINGSVTSGLNF